MLCCWVALCGELVFVIGSILTIEQNLYYQFGQFLVFIGYDICNLRKYEQCVVDVTKWCCDYADASVLAIGDICQPFI